MPIVIWPWDYQFTAQQRWEFWKLGDVNLDGYIDNNDWNAVYGSIGVFNPNYDLNDDGIVDQLDLDIVQASIGLNIWDYFGVAHPTPVWLVIGLIGLVGFVVGGIVWAARKKKESE